MAFSSAEWYARSDLDFTVSAALYCYPRLEPVTSSVSCEHPSPVRCSDVLSPALTPYTSTTIGDSVNFRHDPKAEFRRQSVKDVE